MKKTNENTVTKTTKNNEITVVGKKFKFCINNDTDTELTEQACISLIEWLATPQNSKKYINRYGIIPGGWCINLSDVKGMFHVGTAFDALTGGVVDIIYLIFDNELLNRIVYMDNTILENGNILLPIDNKIKKIPFSFKYVNGTRKRATKKQSTTTEKTNSTTTPKTTQKTDTTKTQKTDKTPLNIKNMENKKNGSAAKKIIKNN